MLLTNSNEESSDEEEMPRNWSVAVQKMKRLQREIKSLKEGHVEEILDAMSGIFCTLPFKDFGGVPILIPEVRQTDDNQSWFYLNRNR